MFMYLLNLQLQKSLEKDSMVILGKSWNVPILGYLDSAGLLPKG